MSEKSIVFVHNTARYLYNLRAELITDFMARDFRVSAIVPRDEYTDKLKTLGVSVFDWELSQYGRNPINEWRSYRGLKSALEAIDADVVFNFTIKPVIYGSLAASQLHEKKIVSMILGRGYVFAEGKFQQALLRTFILPFYTKALSHNHRVFFQNSNDLNSFVERGLVERSRCVLTNGSGVNLRHFSPRSGSEDSKTFLLVARLIEEKGIREYVDAARRLKARYPEAKFQVLGPRSRSRFGIRTRDIEKWAREGTIEYLGETDDVRPYLAACMAFVLPSYYREGVPRASLEAMAMGKPVVTTDWPGCREVVENGENGWIVGVKDVDALAGAMEKLLNNRSLTQRMGAKSRELAEARFDVRSVNAAILKHIVE